MRRFCLPTLARLSSSALLSALAGCELSPAAPREPEPASPMVEYVTRQEVLTPLPLRVRLPSRYGAERVLVFFHTWGSRDWEVLELMRAGQTWSGEISCRAVSTVTGDTDYYFLALDADGHTAVSSGSPDWPHVATIVGELPDGPQSLAGQGALMRCHDPADCPPDFPGCPAYAILRPPCASADDCAEGARCEWDGYCSEAAPIADDDTFDDQDRLEAAVRRATGHRRYAAARAPASR